MGTPRSISPDSLQSSMSCVSGQSMGSTRSGQSTSVTIHPTLFIRDSRRKNHRNAPTRLQLTESDFGFRSPTSLSTKIKRLLSSSALLPKAIFNRHPQSQASVDQSSLSYRPSSPLAGLRHNHHHRKPIDDLFVDPPTTK
ncbi:hypothetical protein MJO28_006066 [Puccinia striiformis f. sp. tritici]|uniref:Uncharacterized protein n=2 Tax=Puccinia striiformis f. sp. tritici TaxID=168172 RepID=A0A0L0V234_9BASI|nr:hypothetical protein Pst134EA_011292 [Puccinia striiformis f. sp. tritici]KAH9467656.1 hypothetical protein Pst134EA_011292 [Puccinia striiformis f. sp. tritici]KAI7953519.1 hypothetical protein MJO28_006066 [Puccinia striiformis f. sp. tritici]KAI7957863.1 hypothetical protein MJO29_006080 [Puccinia striiformis f. sp. tritici]KNE93353.1 hypothetical protein PSTG_13295 [Puccinia striiformis f. sp. tritici PST-78]